ncbi:MAG: hypothetical protein ABSA49_11060 [Rhizomicrobium sp.]
MRKTAILAVALLVANSAAANADSRQRIVCSKVSEDLDSGGRPTAIRFVFDTATMTWWQVGAGNENNTLWADDRSLYLATVNSLAETEHTDFTLDMATLRLEEENAGTVYRCRQDVPESPG